MFSEQNERESTLIIEVKKIAKHSMLFTADKGIELRNEMYSRIHQEDERVLVVIDMKDIETIDSSYCREAFVKIIGLMQIDTDRPQIIFENSTQTVKDNLDESFTVWEKIGVVKTVDGKYSVIGKPSQPLIDTVNVMIKLKKARTKDIANHLDNIPLTTVNNRLKNLYDMCVVTRKEVQQVSGGKEFNYFLNY